jgi:alanyl-tRNA synthetase
VSESAIAAGVRRIEAVTAKGCEDYLYSMEDLLRNVKAALPGNAPEIMVGLRKLLSENEEMRQKIEAFTKERTLQLKSTIIQEKEIVNGITLFKLEGLAVSAEITKDIAFQLRGEFPEKMAFAAVTVDNNKPGLTLMLSDDLVARGLNAGSIVREAARHIEGGGGGQPHFATAGGKNPAGLAKAMETILQKLNQAE